VTDADQAYLLIWFTIAFAYVIGFVMGRLSHDE